jgi:phospholipase C
MAAPLLGSAGAGAATRTSPIKHVIVCCQENHSFDHYFGSYSGLPAGYGIPPGFTQPNGHGGTVKPFHFTSLTENGGDPYHNWTDTHNEWDHGKMDGFYTNDGQVAMGYYTAADLPYYYSLFPKYTLCANYFCGVLSETYPNRLVLYSGTSGGITTNGVNTNGSLNYPCILDLLAKPGYVDTTFSEHSSVLKFIEKVFGLPTLASTNHQFDTSTPRGSNYEGNGAPFPPRDGNSKLSDLTQCFTVPVAGPAR